MTTSATLNVKIFSSSLLNPHYTTCNRNPSNQPHFKSRVDKYVFILSPGEELDEVEVKQTQVSQYESMQISTILQPYPNDQTGENNDNTGRYLT